MDLLQQTQADKPALPQERIATFMLTLILDGHFLSLVYLDNSRRRQVQIFNSLLDLLLDQDKRGYDNDDDDEEEEEKKEEDDDEDDKIVSKCTIVSSFRNICFTLDKVQNVTLITPVQLHRDDCVSVSFCCRPGKDNEDDSFGSRPEHIKTLSSTKREHERPKPHFDINMTRTHLEASRKYLSSYKTPRKMQKILNLLDYIHNFRTWGRQTQGHRFPLN
ncbi:hypothetical protein RRG08_026256 [Elysia crispata]|uniref:Uncharacterized protein n=1 Tax=Elysia crispata TaxID=231223 RepID=A0AAE0ZAM1_9GAST|nr:hypothetical protein RRG08_026256 [Elysia crispata]